jgi:hypothetical protein
MLKAENAEAAALAELGFDPGAYRSRYGDLQANLGSGAEIEHFHGYGLREGREAPVSGPLAPVFARLAALWPEPVRRHDIARAIVLGRISERRAEPLSPEGALDLIAAAAHFPPVLVIGDSHAQMYGGAAIASDRLVLSQICWAGSARGLANPASKGQYGVAALGFLESLRSGLTGPMPPILFHFGQVDVEFVYNFRRLRGGERRFDLADFESFVAETVAIYVRYLESVRLRLGHAAIFAASINPPALNDAAVSQGYVNGHVAYLHTDEEVAALEAGLRRLEFPDQVTRTQLHATFNTALSRACNGSGIGFVSVFDRLCSGGVAAEVFTRAHGGTDHHLDFNIPETREIAGLIVAAVERDAGERVRTSRGFAPLGSREGSERLPG